MKCQAGEYPETAAAPYTRAQEVAERRGLFCSVLASLPAGEGLTTAQFCSLFWLTRPQAYTILRALKAEGVFVNTLERAVTAYLHTDSWLGKASIATWQLNPQIARRL